MLSLIIPAHNAEGLLPACFASIQASERRPDQIILVDDSSNDGTAALAASFGATVMRTERQSGPAIARNLGARAAQGDLLFFLDSDCLLHSDTLQRAEAAFGQDPELAAIIGAYDLEPESNSFLSKFRNLMHSYYHHGSRRSVNSFWGACGAVRREAFFSVGGFSEAFRRPSIEDVEFGLRLHESGSKIELDPAIQVKHRKRWTLWTMLRTDIRDRAIPWTKLILSRGKMENDLNTSYGQRLSVFLVLLSPWLAPFAWPLSALSLLIVVALNWPLYRFLARHWNVVAAAASVPLHLLYFAYSGLAFGSVILAFRLRLMR